jgi:hypothetical protein
LNLPQFARRLENLFHKRGSALGYQDEEGLRVFRLFASSQPS